MLLNWFFLNEAEARRHDCVQPLKTVQLNTSQSLSINKLLYDKLLNKCVFFLYP